MSIKTRIKNDMWRWNYVIPFIKKHQFDEKGKADVIKWVIMAYQTIKPIKAKKRSVGNDTRELLSKINITINSDSRFVYFIDTTKTLAAPGNILSNFTLDYARIVHGSFKDLVVIGNSEMKAVADGIDILRKRIVNELGADSRAKFFKEMLEKPAEHFDEALQRILFFNQILWQNRHRLNGLGRLDKILADFYEKDGLTKAEAKKIILDFYNQLSKYKEYKSDALMGDIGQIVVLGGIDSDGSYFCNDLTYIFLEAQAELNKPDPKTFLRVSKKMPDELLRVAIQCLQSKNGSPLFSNDDVIIPCLKDFGVDEATEYCVSACWEPFIVGKSMDQNNVAVFDYFPALDEVLSGEYKNWNELVDAYVKKNKERFENFLDGIDNIKWAKDPLVSMFTYGCENKDISEGAAKYNNYGITTVAISNVVDSLLNIKQLMREGVSLKDINSNRNRDGLSKHFGHDEDDAIELSNRLALSLAEVACNFKNRLGGTVKFGFSSPGYNILSKKSAADLSGKKSGEPYNTHISCMDATYTEVVNFASKLNYDRQRFNGNVVDFFCSSEIVSNEKFFAFMKAAIRVGFFQMQLNVLDSKTLIDAKKYPEKYAGLIVRVWGFSAYFNDLPESYKELLIERAIAAEKKA